MKYFQETICRDPETCLLLIPKYCDDTLNESNPFLSPNILIPLF